MVRTERMGAPINHTVKGGTGGAGNTSNSGDSKNGNGGDGGGARNSIEANGETVGLLTPITTAIHRTVMEGMEG